MKALIIVTTYYYTLLQQLLLHCYFIHVIINCWFQVVFLAVDVEGGNSEALMVITTYYYTLLQQLLLHCYFIYVDINCRLILPPCCKTRRKMLVFDRPTIFHLTLELLSCSPLYSLPFHLVHLYKCLIAGRKTRGYIRYSHLLYFPLLLCLIGRCSRRWSPGAGDSSRSLLRRRVLR